MFTKAVQFFCRIDYHDDWLAVINRPQKNINMKMVTLNDEMFLTDFTMICSLGSSLIIQNFEVFSIVNHHSYNIPRINFLLLLNKSGSSIKDIIS